MTEIVERRTSARRKASALGLHRPLPGRRSLDVGNVVDSSASNYRPILTDSFAADESAALRPPREAVELRLMLRLCLYFLAVAAGLALFYSGSHRNQPTVVSLRADKPAVPFNRAVYRWSGFHRVGSIQGSVFGTLETV